MFVWLLLDVPGKWPSIAHNQLVKSHCKIFLFPSGVEGASFFMQINVINKIYFLLLNGFLNICW